MAELPALRRPVVEPASAFRGPVARRMQAAVWPHCPVFITPMAAVAGAVADHLLAAATAGRTLEKLVANDGGDLALHLAAGATATIGVVADLERPRLDGSVEIAWHHPVRGVATSGRGGRSFSRGIADAVTVLAWNAAAADAAATLIANAVDVDHPAVRRRPAVELDPDSDLSELPVTTGLGALESAAIDAALAAGVGAAERMRGRGLIVAAALWLRGRVKLVGPFPPLLPCRS